jgi:hypothetical protein
MGPTLQPDSKLLGLVFKRDPKLLDMMLQPDSFKLGSYKLDIIINIKNIIICIINIIIIFIINIINIIINKFEKILLILKNNHRFDLKG